MKWVVKLFLFGLIGQVWADTGALFTITSYGTALQISTTTPNYNYRLAGVKLNPSSAADYAFSNPDLFCSRWVNGTCIFSLNNTSPRIIPLIGTTGTLQLAMFLNGLGPLSGQNYTVSIQQQAFVSNGDSNTISLCSVAPNGQLGGCTTEPTPGITLTRPFQIALNRANTIAYIAAGSNNQVYKCTLNEAGQFEACSDSGNSGVAFNDVIGIALNRLNTRAYVTNRVISSPSSSYVSVCPILANGDFGACVDSGNSGVPFVGAAGIVLNAAETHAYVTNFFNNSVSICPIQIGGDFGACYDAGNTGLPLITPAGLALNTNNSIAYMTNFTTNQVVRCPIQADTRLGFCESVNNTGAAFNAPVGISLNTIGTLAYVANEAPAVNSVLLCAIKADGAFGQCTPSGGPYGAPRAITLN